MLKELLRKLPDSLLGCDLYDEWLSVADKTPADVAPAIRRFVVLLTLLYC